MRTVRAEAGSPVVCLTFLILIYFFWEAAAMGEPQRDPSKTNDTSESPSETKKRKGSPAWTVVAVLCFTGVAVMTIRPVSKEAGRALPVAPGAGSGHNVVLITLDTLRADRLGCYGYGGAETLHLDKLAGGGVRFADAVCTAPLTLPSHSSILTGDYPPRHGVRDNGTYRLTGEKQTLAEVLGNSGYDTAAFIASFVLDRRYGTSQGFDVYDDRIGRYSGDEGERTRDPERSGDKVVDSALKWLEKHNQEAGTTPFFAWVHLYDPHAPYLPPEPWRTRFAERLYDGEVAFVDYQVGRLLDQLDKTGVREKTILVIVGDHGESLGDHGEDTHGLLVYEAAVHVPFILNAPGLLPAGLVVEDRVVSTVDIAPTILDLLGLPRQDCDGKSLLRGPHDATREVYMETMHTELNHGWSSLYALRRHTDKYIEAPMPEYYDLKLDPRETDNRIGAGSDDGQLLSDHLAETKEKLTALASGEDSAVTPDADALEKLSALGYLGSKPIDSDGPLPDPKDMVLRWRKLLDDYQACMTAGNVGQAAVLVEQAIKKSGTDHKLWSMLAAAQSQLGNTDDAIASYLKVIELEPMPQAGTWVQLAKLQQIKGDAEAAQVSLQQAEKIDPDCGSAYLMRAQLALAAKQYEECQRLCQKVVEVDPGRLGASALLLLAGSMEEQGRKDETRYLLQKAYAADPRDAAVVMSMARSEFEYGRYESVVQLLNWSRADNDRWGESRLLIARANEKLGRVDEAVSSLKSLIDRSPEYVEAYHLLGALCHRNGRYEEAAKTYAALVAQSPNDPLGYYGLAVAKFKLGDVDGSIDGLQRAISLKEDYAEARLQLALVLSQNGRDAEALQQCRSLLGFAPEELRAIGLAAELAHRTGNDAEAVELLRGGLKQLPNDAGMLNDLAWRLATVSDASLRNGAEAVELAEKARAIVGEGSPAVLDTLAAALAAAGDFTKAVETANTAADLAESMGQADLSREIRERVALYEVGQAYVE